MLKRKKKKKRRRRRKRRRREKEERGRGDGKREHKAFNNWRHATQIKRRPFQSGHKYRNCFSCANLPPLSIILINPSASKGNVIIARVYCRREKLTEEERNTPVKGRMKRENVESNPAPRVNSNTYSPHTYKWEAERREKEGGTRCTTANKDYLLDAHEISFLRSLNSNKLIPSIIIKYMMKKKRNESHVKSKDLRGEGGGSWKFKVSIILCWYFWILF